MKPSWLTVEYARTFLMSFCVIATVAAMIAVAAPIVAMMAMTVGAWSTSGLMRASR